MSRNHLALDIRAEGVRFELRTKPMLGTGQPIPIARWTQEAPPSLLPGVGRLSSWADDGQATTDATSVTVPHEILAQLDERGARALQLPATCPFILDLGHDGTLDRPDFRFRTAWRRGTSQAVAGVRRTGAFVEAGGKTYRLPTALFSVIEAVDAVHATPAEDMDERFRIWGRLQALLPEETQRSIEVDGYLRSTRIAHAARFSLQLESGGDGFTFSPLLYGPGAEGADPYTTEEAAPSETESLLPPAQQRLFAGRRFPESADCKPRYALGTGWYVVLDEGVRQALGVVRRAQGADRETRRQFARNPRAYLRQTLGDQLDEAAIDALFVETAEYSARVEDVGLWAPVALPWVMKPTEPWLPETRGLRIGDRLVTMQPDELPQLEAAIRQAISLNEDSVDWHGTPIPANESSLSAIQELAQSDARADDDPPAGREDAEAAAPKSERERVVLQIASHFEDVTYRRTLKPRRSPLADGPPAALVTAPKPHQVDGIAWLQQRWREGMPGVLVADDMGLGKTLQALAFLAWLREGMQTGAVHSRPILIVAPTGLLKNWEEEHAKHLAEPGLGQPLRGYGAELRGLRAAGRGNELNLGRALLDADRLRTADWILTTYETMRDYQHSFGAVRYAVVVFDEAQRIKTPGSLMTNAAKALNGDFIVTMTGTPVENRLADLCASSTPRFPACFST